MSRVITNRALCPLNDMSSCCVAFICSLDHRKMSAVTRHLSPIQFLGTEAEFGHISSGFPILTITTSLFHTQLSIFTEVCQRPNQAAHYYILLLNTLNAELNPICYLLALIGAHHFLHVSRIRVKSLTLRLLMSYIYGAPILDVSRSHTTTQHSR